MTDPTAYTSPETRGECAFCGKEENGYTKPDKNGMQQAACWPCVSEGLETTPATKRALVKTDKTEDLDKDAKLKAAAKEAKKVKGLAPSTQRASTW